MTDAFDLHAAALRADEGEVAVQIAALAAWLEGSLPDHTTIRRKSARLFGGRQRVSEIQVSLGEHDYWLAFDGDRTQCTRGRTVRGVQIKREPLSLGEWLQSLESDLRDQAAQSEQARSALARLVN